MYILGNVDTPVMCVTKDAGSCVILSPVICVIKHSVTVLI